MSHYYDCPEPGAMHGTYNKTPKKEAPVRPISFPDAEKLLKEMATVMEERAPNIPTLTMDVVLSPKIQNGEWPSKGTIEYKRGCHPVIQLYIGQGGTKQYLDSPFWLPHVPEKQWELVLSTIVREQQEYLSGPPLRRFLGKLNQP